MSENEPEELTTDKARKLLDAEKRKRERDCMAAIEATLAEYRCRLHIIEVRVDGEMQGAPRLQTEALE